MGRTVPRAARFADLVDPATETQTGKLAMGTAEDADRAVAAARAAFPAWSESSREERIALLERVIEAYRARLDDIAEAVRSEIGAPIALCKALQAADRARAASGGAGRRCAISSSRRNHGNSYVRREAIGVAALITPWNWPLNQITAKVAPALAAGCTIVLKPSEIAPLDAIIFAEIMHEAGAPPGVFNMMFGDGARRRRARCPRIPTSTWCRSPVRRVPVWKSPSAPRPRSSAWRRNSAASRRC